MNTFIFLRHAETSHDSKTNAADWVLSEEGYEKSLKLVEDETFKNIDLIFTSTEVKAVLTVKPLSKFYNLEITKMPEFDEVRRSDIFLSDEDFKANKIKQLEDLNFPAFGGETVNEALKRFTSGINIINDNFTDKKILVVSHGTILTAYFGKVLGDYSNLSERWKKTGFCSYGIIKNNEIVQDIIH